MTTIPRNRAARTQIDIAERLPAHPDASELLQAFYREQVGRYGFADPVELDSSEYAAPNGVFVVAYRCAVPVGCGGYRWLDRSACTIEIKKAYVLPGSRGQGAGRAVMSWLERHAIAGGARRALLETGVRNTAALHLFTRAGYQPTDGYVEDRDPAINRAFAKPLTSPAQAPDAGALQASAR
jgi:GNAT superfamily N-acetyltransferase